MNPKPATTIITPRHIMSALLDVCPKATADTRQKAGPRPWPTLDNCFNPLRRDMSVLYYGAITGRHKVREAGPRDPSTSGVCFKFLEQETADGLSPETRAEYRTFNSVPSARAKVELVQVLARAAALRATYHPDYDRVAAVVLATHWQRTAPPSFAEAIERMRDHVHQETGRAAPLISKEIADLVLKNGAARHRIECAMKRSRDYDIPYAGLVKMRHSYLTVSSTGELLETPQYLWMRVALGIHGPAPNRLDDVLETYDMMSKLIAVHATPTLINAGRPIAQMASCFLATVGDDSIEGIYDTLRQCARVSQRGGGLGVSWSHVRAAGSYVAGCNGRSNGLVAWHRQYNVMVEEVDQGGGKRKGALASYLEPWHADFPDWLQLKLPQAANEARRARHLYYGVWMPDLLMERAQRGEQWSLFCPNEAKGLCDVWGDAFRKLYEHYEAQGKARRVVPARALLQTLCERQIETGGPYLMYKDACNRKSNQQHLGTTRGSNLCTEITQFSSKDEMAVCNLASIALPRFVHRGKTPPKDCGDHTLWTKGAQGADAWLDLVALSRTVRALVRNLNRVIVRNHYPVPQARRSNLRHRPIGLGVQGFADLLSEMGWAWSDPGARRLNREVFETIYYSALAASCELAKQAGEPHVSYEGSPASRGLLQMDLWEKEGKLPKAWKGQVPLPTGLWDWDELREWIKRYGLINSLLVAPMPTVSTSKILGNSPGIEPYHAHVYVEKALSGDAVHMTRGLVERLIARGLWTEEVRDEILRRDGVLRDCERVPADLKHLYPTGWEVRLKDQVDMVADRGPFVDQSQSFNVWLAGSSPGLLAENLQKMHVYGWRRGLKTGSYYVRTQVQFGGQKFALSGRSLSSSSVGGTRSPSPPTDSSDKTSDDSELSDEETVLVCPLRRSPGDDGDEECEACGS